MSEASDQQPSRLAFQAREQFVDQLVQGLPAVAQLVDERFDALLDEAGSISQVQDRRDARILWRQRRDGWLRAATRSLAEALRPRFSPSGHGLPSGLALVSDGDIDDQIMASRLAMRVLDDAATELNELRLRIQHLEHRPELDRQDILLPETVARLLLDQWLACDMQRDAWAMVQGAAAAALARATLEAYRVANRFLVLHQVLPEIPLHTLVRRSSCPVSRPAPLLAEPAVPPAPSAPVGAWPAAAGGDATTRLNPVDAETRMLTHVSPLARARLRAQGVFGRLRRLLGERAGLDLGDSQLGVPTGVVQPSPGLQRYFAEYRHPEPQTQRLGETDGAAFPAHPVVHDVQGAIHELRARSGELKRAAGSPAEKATVEMVGLMFLSILSEERIPASVRVWFARLQMPVLRLALSEPNFFGALHHPARRLIDRMGSCMLGFEHTASPQRLEAEIKRVVQVIEQYPETGRRVFELMKDEFEKFLGQYLVEAEPTRRAMGVAQQVEHKETLTIQYTIELRRWLSDLPVGESLRDFLYKVWAEVLALSSVKHGPRHERTLRHKQVAQDLLWAASAKPTRADRARVIEQMPALLQQLREGMAELGFDADRQDAEIAQVRKALGDAFMARGAGIPDDRLADLARRLEHLQDILPEEELRELSLQPDRLAILIGEEAGGLELVASGGSLPGEAMLDWAREITIGEWFQLDHNGQTRQVQLVWRSERGHLLLFVDVRQRALIFPLPRVAAYLQAGLLLPSEEEALTVRATRDALAKLEANPERLLDRAIRRWRCAAASRRAGAPPVLRAPA